MGISSINVQNSMGSNGSVYSNGTGAVTGDFIAIQFTEDSVLGAISTNYLTNSADLISDGTTFSQGQTLMVPCSSVTLSSGAAILYKA